MNNSKKEEFKLFVKANPFLINIINNSNKTWQDLFEFYDLYGTDEESWNKLLEGINTTTTKENKTTNNLNNRLDEIIKMAKNIDVDKVQEGITSLQKTLSLFGDLFLTKNNNNNTTNYNPRPLYRRFED
ncbi:MAG: hypothetical protein IKF19_06755 [Bacilli bacterium]|nr:hypothetical protein [Bacilli bacterium]